MEEEVVASAAKERTDEGRSWGLQAWDSQKILLGTSRDVFAGAAAAASVGALTVSKRAADGGGGTRGESPKAPPAAAAAGASGPARRGSHRLSSP